MEDNNTQKAGKTLRGTVVGTDMEKTAKVAVSRYVKHPKYKKFIKQVKKFLVHDPENSATVGDKVVIRESRPISKNKNFVIETNETTAK
ncbi:30S ribosomal protein S17 [Candidatus Kaiserbacteria bacterium]|nr:MAG: 30S ribosomal protein S17 [Candidatus Kaiserbacteria bacterium]PCI89560.1 MAG: 30S ribosomal protein S17 [Candidatus Kaiserbacteria bacterium]PCI89894.1 MAG: 30S ribosomal protein S17 [Candidatus Kaiserbacteria bacterium]